MVHHNVSNQKKCVKKRWKKVKPTSFTFYNNYYYFSQKFADNNNDPARGATNYQQCQRNEDSEQPNPPNWIEKHFPVFSQTKAVRKRKFKITREREKKKTHAPNGRDPFMSKNVNELSNAAKTGKGKKRGSSETLRVLYCWLQIEEGDKKKMKRENREWNRKEREEEKKV